MLRRQRLGGTSRDLRAAHVTDVVRQLRGACRILPQASGIDGHELGEDAEHHTAGARAIDRGVDRWRQPRIPLLEHLHLELGGAPIG